MRTVRQHLSGLSWGLAPLALSVMIATTARGAVIVPEGSVKLEDMTVQMPDGWQMTQEATSGDVVLAGFSRGDDFVTFYVRRGTGVEMRSVFVNGSQVVNAERAATYGSHQWTLLQTRKTAQNAAAVHVAAFMTTYRGNTYYGYSRAKDQNQALANVQAFLGATN